MNSQISPICNAGALAAALNFKNWIVMCRWCCHPGIRRLIAVVLMLGVAGRTMANPLGLTVRRGTATATTDGSQLTVVASQNAVLNWQSFNIDAGETTIFQQPSSSSIVWNRINDQNPSQIYGSLQANGIVVLLNSSGFYFGPNSFVSAAGLVVSTANYLPPQNSGSGWEFNGPPPLASIVNYGRINIGGGGSAFLIADSVVNHGTISAPGGTVGLAAGQTVLLSERPDGRGMSMRVTLPAGSVDNDGRLIADGGTIAMNARVVNQDGFIQANSVRNVNGTIELVAADQLNLGADSQVVAHGDGTASASSGGNVTLQSGNSFSDSVGSQIDVSGGLQGGNGGNVEISAPNILSLKSVINAGAPAGWQGGVFSLDPLDIVLGTVSSGPPDDNGTIDGTSGSGVFYVDVNNEFQNITAGQILLKASGNIYVGDGTVSPDDGSFSAASGVTWDLSSSTGFRYPNGQLTLQAEGNITFVDGSLITDANGWNVTLQAGYNFNNNSITYGTGSIYLNGGLGMTGSGSIQTATGNIDLQAGQDILVGSGFVRTTGGGSVSASALKGDINTGTYDHGYEYLAASTLNFPYYEVDATYGVGGMSTEAGGNVTLTAGGDVTSFLPGSDDATDAGTGVFGPQLGSVKIVAGGDVTGHYVEGNADTSGTGNIYAGVKMVNGIPVDADGNPVTDGKSYVLDSATGSAGTSGSKLALSLVAGGWTVNAAQDIFLQEVRNPNGVFNDGKSGRTLLPTYHHFDYAPDAYVNLSAGNAVQLGDSSTSLPRASDVIPFIYAPILNISAGAGGVTLNGGTDPYDQLILFPSAQGSLTITTTGGGSLSGNLPASSDGSLSIFNLIVSDSGLSQYLPASDQIKFFGFSRNIFGLDDHKDTPVHYNNPTPIVLDISGDMNFVQLVAPEAAQITVHGDMNNSRFQGMNLSSDPNQNVQVEVRELDGSLGTATVHPGVTSIHVTGDIINRGEFTIITLPSGAQVPAIAQLAHAVSPSDVTLALNLARELFYDPNTGQLTLQGALTDDVLSLLQNLTVQVYKNGKPQFNSDGSAVTQTVSIIDAATATALSTEYATLGPIPTTSNSGYLLGGGGEFNITAHNMDLGTTLGILSYGVSSDTVKTLNPNGGTTISYPLAKYFTQGANIVVNVSGNLEMFSTSIATLNDGNIYVNAGGNIDVGSSVFSANSSAPRGIYSTIQGNVDVYAGGNIDVNGSRIAAYDTRPNSAVQTPGGSVTVVSRDGSINAGNGSSGFVTFDSFLVSGQAVQVISSTIPGSGIMEVSYTDNGNILVEAPNGTINAGAGGILQLLLNGPPLPESTTLFDQPLDQAGLAKMFDLALTGNMKAALTLQQTLNGNPGNSQVGVYAGYELQQLDGSGNPSLDAYGNPMITAENLLDGTLVKVSDARDIDATGSGVIGAGSVTLNASGNITGNIFALNNVNVNAINNINVSVLGLGNVNVNSAGGNISGTIIGINGVSASGGSIDANLESNGSVSGDTSGQSGLAPGTAADAASQGMTAQDASKTVAAADDQTNDEKQKSKKAVLTQKTGRVTVILPARQQPPQSQSPEPRT